MTEKAEFDLDRALAGLAADVNGAAPRPGPELMARVLADAGSLSTARVALQVPVRAASGGPRLRLSEMLFGWTSGAAAAFALCLALGVGVGLGLEPGDLPMLDDADDIAIMAMDDSPFSEEIL